MENVFVGMQVCGYVGVAAAAMCVFYVCLLATVDSQVTVSQFLVVMHFPGSVFLNDSLLDMFFILLRNLETGRILISINA